MRVVEERPDLMEVELVDMRRARLDRVLLEVRDAVVRYRHFDAVKVQRSLLGQVVLDDEADAVALRGLERRTGHAAVVAPRLHEPVREEFLLDGLGGEVPLLDSVNDPGRLGDEVGPGDRHRGQAGAAQAGHQLAQVVVAARRASRSGLVAIEGRRSGRAVDCRGLGGIGLLLGGGGRCNEGGGCADRTLR